MEAIKYYLSSNLNEGILSLIKDNSIFTITDSLGRLEFVSDNYCTLLESRSNKLLGETQELWKSHLHTDILYKNLWRTIKMRRKWTGILSETLPSGKVVYIDTTIIPIKDEVDNSIKYIGLYDDITEIHQKNNLLNSRNSEDRDFLNMMPFHVFLITKHGKVLNVNKNYRGLEVPEMIDTYIYDHVSLDSFEILKKNIDYVNSERVPNQFEIIEVDSIGKQCNYSVLVSPVFNEQGGMQSLTVMIKENRQTYTINEDREIGKKCRLIYQSINVGIIVVTDSKGNITQWNKGAEAAFGYTASEILGKPLTVLISKTFRKKSIKELLKVTQKLENNQDIDLIEMYCLGKNKKEFPVEFALSSLTFRGKKIYCAMMLDISKRKALENKLKEKTKDLELFLYRSAHDLKAPFSTAEGLLNLLKEEKTNDRTQLFEMLDKTMAKGKILSESLAQASLIPLKKDEYSHIEFDSIIKNVLRLISSTHSLDAININTDINTPFAFYSSPKLFSSIFHNLIQNSIQYSKPSSIKNMPFINISVKTDENHAMITVKDNGVGIEQANIDNVFDLYFRANRQDIPGNGLGLYVVKSIVEDLEGDIRIKSNINKGTCLEIRIPNP